MKTLSQLRAELGEKIAAMKTLQEKAFGAEGTDEDLQAVKNALAEVKRIEGQIEVLEDAQAAEARASKAAPVTTAPATRRETLPAVPAKQHKEEEALPMIMASYAKSSFLFKSQGVQKHPFEVLADEGYQGLVDQIHYDAQTKGLNTLVSAEGGILVPAATIGGGIIPMLRPRSTFLQANPVRVELVNGRFTQATETAGSSAGYIAEGGLKPLSQPAFGSINMGVKKLAGITLVTEEMQRWAVVNMVNFITNSLRKGMAAAFETAAWLGTGAGASPLGILNKVGVQTQTFTAVSATAPTVAEVENWLRAVILKLTTNNFVPSDRWRIIMSTRTAMYLASLRLDSGDLAFPGMQGAGIREGLNLGGIPVLIVPTLPTNGGGTTDEAIMALIDWDEVMYGEEMAVNVRMTTEASVTPDGTNWISLFQTNQTAVLVESMHDVGVQRPLGIVKSTVRF